MSPRPARSTKRPARKRPKTAPVQATPKTVVEPEPEVEEEYDYDEGEVDYSAFPLICLIWGKEGSGKSQQAMQFEQPALILDVENRLQPLAMKNEFPMESLQNVVSYDKRYRISGTKTLTDIRETIEQILTDKNLKTFIVDGISDIRPYAVAEWLEENAAKRQRPNTPGDWRDINDKVRDICFSVINWGRARGVNVVFTAQSGDDYQKGEKVGEIAQCKTWVYYNVDQKFRFYTENGKYLAFCEKSWYNPLFTVDLTNASLHDLLRNPRALRENIEEYQNELARKRRAKPAKR